MSLLLFTSCGTDYYVGEVRFIAEQEKVIFVDDFIRRRSALAIRRQDTPELQKELATIMPDLNSLAEQANLKTALIAVARIMSIRVNRCGPNLVVAKRP